MLFIIMIPVIGFLAVLLLLILSIAAWNSVKELMQTFAEETFFLKGVILLAIVVRAVYDASNMALKAVKRAIRATFATPVDADYIVLDDESAD